MKRPEILLKQGSLEKVQTVTRATTRVNTV